MEIKIDYWLRKDGVNRLMHTIITEEDIKEMVISKFRNGELPCPIHYDKDEVDIEVDIDQVII